MRPVNHQFPNFDPQFAHDTLPYGIVQTGLVDTIGHYCSICETPIRIDGFFLEHILTNVRLLRQIRKDYWDQLLLVCFECQTQKIDRHITEANYLEYAWPFDTTYSFSLDNSTYPSCIRPFMYVLREVNVQNTPISGEVVVVEANNILDNTFKNKIQNVIDLYQLNTRYYESSTHSLKQTPANIRQQDMRLFNRTEAWKQAKRLLEDPEIRQVCSQYNSNNTSVVATALRFVSTMAMQTGFWSVWMTVFWQEFKNPALLHELFVETVRRPGDLVSGYQGMEPPSRPLTPDAPLTPSRRPDGSTSNVTYRHFPGTATERIFYRQ